MWLYIIIFLIPIIYFILQGRNGAKNTIFLVAYMIFLALFVGFSDMLGGYDRYIYGEVFDRMADVTREGGNPWKGDVFSVFGTEFGYGSLNAIISFFTSNRYIFILIVTLIIYLLLYKSFKEYIEDYPMALILFMGLWFFFTFTYLRQVLAATIIWFSIRYIIDRDLKRFLLVWFIAYSFHNSAILFLPVYFIVTKRIPMPLVLMGMGMILLLGISPLPSILFETYGRANEIRVEGRIYERDAGFRIEYLLEAITFLYLIALQYKNLLDSKKNVILTNIALLFCAVLLFYVKSSDGGRLSWYFLIGIVATLSRMDILERVKGYRPIVITLCLFLFLRILTSWDILLSPYKSFLTDGFREGDYIHENFEYDQNYDLDKFYRK